MEVRGQHEILATLDNRGCLDSLPFMPEMLPYCGKQFRVYKRADKTCDTISGGYKSRRMFNCVHLADLRCDGSAHGDCDTTCLLFWKEAWLKRPEGRGESTEDSEGRGVNDLRCTVDDLERAAKVDVRIGSDGGIYSCQATELLRASSPLRWWDLRQYWREIRSKNIVVGEVCRILFIGALNWVFGKRGFGRLFYIVTGDRRYPFMNTKLMAKDSTPVETLDLVPGEIVQVKDLEEILRTLKDWRNRGLTYDRSGEMLKYCGKKLKVLKRVKKVIDENSGRLLTLKNESVILEGAICCGHYSPDRLCCPRSLYPFWREIWLQRVDPGSSGGQ